VQDGRIHIELLNGPMLFDLKATPAEYSARYWPVSTSSGRIGMLSTSYVVRPIDKERQGAIVSRQKDGDTTLAEKREVSMWGLIIASSVCGLLFARYFKIYALIPAALVLSGIACFLASKQGLAVGVLSLVLATVAMQLCYFLSVVVITVFMDNFEPAKAPTEEISVPDHDLPTPRVAIIFGRVAVFLSGLF
jgi:hypothetical protein